MIRCLILLLMMIQFPILAHAHTQTSNDGLKFAFIREGNLWLFSEGKEEQITQEKVQSPSWSFDGKFLSYEKKVAGDPRTGPQDEIWVYNVETRSHERITNNGYNAQWAPMKNLIAYKSNGVLSVSNIKGFYNIALGVDEYGWLPDASGFLVSSSARLHPDGWTNPILYTARLPAVLTNMYPPTNVKKFYTIPKEIGKGKNKIMSINAGSFEFSPNRKWISFIVSPTASWSMDSNMLCVIRRDGQDFQVVDEVIFGVGAPKWAPSKDILAYIAGGGRIVAGFKDKDLKSREFPVAAKLTPEHFAELDFTWKDDHTIITSRVKETEWSNDFSKHPLPVLYAIDIGYSEQKQITHPPQGQGDYHPKYLIKHGKLTWCRGQSITSKCDVWISNPDGSQAKRIIGNVDAAVFYEK